VAEDCIFCQIVEGKIPSYKVWEDENFLAFLDIHPVFPGHTLVIPKKHFRWIWEVENYGEYFEKVREVAVLLKEKLNAEWIQVNVMGNDVSHAHVHLIPRYPKGKMELGDFTEILQKIRQQDSKISKA